MLVSTKKLRPLVPEPKQTQPSTPNREVPPPSATPIVTSSGYSSTALTAVAAAVAKTRGGK